MKPHYGYYALGYYVALTGATLAASASLITALGDRAAVRVGGGVLFGYGVIAAVGSWVGVYVLPENRLRRAERIAVSLEDNEVKRILDVGSGRGLLAIAFAKRFPQSRVVAVDIWQPRARKRRVGYDPTAPVLCHTAERTRKNACVEGVAERLDLLTSDATQLALEKETFDVITCAYLLFHLHAGLFRRDDTPRRRCVEELFRVLRPGGRLVVFELVVPSGVNLLAWTPLGYLGMRLLSKPLTVAYWETLLNDNGFLLERKELRRGNLVLIARKP